MAAGIAGDAFLRGLMGEGPGGSSPLTYRAEVETSLWRGEASSRLMRLKPLLR